MRFLCSLAWRDLRASGRSLWVFCACLVLGVALVAASGGLFRQVAGSLQSDARMLFGGDVELEQHTPLPPDALQWARERGTVSLMTELRTMLRSTEGSAHLVALQSVDSFYPLYGEVTLAPAEPLDDLLAQREGTWGILLDAVLAQRLGLQAGATVELGNLRLQVRGVVLRQPDRSLRADWSGAPVLVAAGALQATGLVQPLSRVDYRYRVRTDMPAAQWRDAYIAAFADSDTEVRTFEERSERVTEVLGQIGSGLLLVGFSALFIGGLGVFNSVQAWLQGKLGTLASLRALGLRDARLVALVLLQVLMLALGSSAVGAVLGAALALAGAGLASGPLPLAPAVGQLVAPSLMAMAFGVATAMTFALPALGRALTVSPAALFRGIDAAALRTPRLAWLACGASALVLVGMLVAAMPDWRFAIAFVAVAALLLLLLEAVMRGLRALAHRVLLRRTGWQPPFAMRMALTGLQRAGSPLRVALLSLGSALTLLVACTLVVAALLRVVNETLPQQAPALVFYDVQTEQLPVLAAAMQAAQGPQRLHTAPLVLGRIASVNGQPLRESGDGERAREARDEQKLSNRAGNIDDVVVVQGAWWPADYRGEPLVAMEDREAGQIGLQVGDRIGFDILGTVVEAKVAAIYAQRRMQSRLWLEAIFSDGVLDPFITRHVGAAWLSEQEAIAAQDRLAAQLPNVVSVRTGAMLREARALMGRASAGLVVVAGVCLAASLLVLASVVAASRARLVYESSVMHALGARLASLRQTLAWEYALLALVTSVFAVLVGGALATALLQLRLDLSAGGLYWTGVATAVLVSATSLGLGARYLMRRMALAPAVLLRSGG
jgi:putative ABC transport system permease protein